MPGEVLLLLFSQGVEFPRNPGEDYVAERWAASGLKKAAPSGQYVIDEGDEGAIVTAVTQQREGVPKFPGQLRVTAGDVHSGLVVGHRSSSVV